MTALGKEDLSLLQTAISQGILQKQDVIALLQAHRARYESTQHFYTGHFHHISGQGKVFWADEEQTLQLAPLLYRARDWKTWGTQHLLLDAQGHPIETLTVPENTHKTLIQWIQSSHHEAHSYTFDPHFSTALWHAPQSQLWFPEITQARLLSGPVDLLLTSTPYLFVGDRSRGVIEVYDLQTGAPPQLIDTLAVRNSPSSLALAMAFDGQLLHFHSQENSTLISYNPQTQQSEKRELGLGKLGNLWAEAQRLWILVRKPHPTLVSLDLIHDEIEEIAKLPGELNTNRGSAPIDTLSFDPQSQLWVLNNTQTEGSTAFQQQLIQVATSTGRVQHHPLNLSDPLLGISFAHLNPALAVRDQSIWALIFEAGLMTEADYQALKQAEAAPAVSEAAELPPATVSTPSQPAPLTPFAKVDDEKAPDHCPLCHHRLMGLWDCPVCGYEVPHALRKQYQRIASYRENHGLAPGFKVLPDPKRQRLVVLDHHHKVQQVISYQEQLPQAHAQDVVSLGHQHWLCSDVNTGLIWQMDDAGNVLWQWPNTPDNPRHHPLKTTVFLRDQQLFYLGIDADNATVSISTEGAQPPQLLSAPSPELGSPQDVQYTHRNEFVVCYAQGIVRFDREGTALMVYRKEDYNWHQLRFCRYNTQDEMWVVDIGSHEMIQLDPQGVIQQRFFYYRDHLPEAMQVPQPTFFHRLDTGDFLLSDTTRVIEIVVKARQLRWHENLEHLQLPATAPPSQATNPSTPPPPPKVSTRRPTAPPPPATASTGGFQVPRKKVVGNRLEALLKKNVTAPAKESYSPSIVYKDPVAPLDKRSFYLLDHKNNSVIRINRKGKVLWHYGFDLGQQLQKPAFCLTEGQTLWIADTYQHRLLALNMIDKAVHAEYTGPRTQPLRSPRGFCLTDTGILVADQQNRRLIELSRETPGQILWSFADPQWISTPHSVQCLPNGHILYTDAYLNTVVEINRQQQVVWRYRRGLFSPMFATRLTNGNTLIADTHHHRVLEVTPDKHTVWEYIGHAKSNRLNPTHVERLPNGNTLITYFNHSKLVELTPDKKCVWSYTLGKDLFQAPVQGDEEIHVRQEGKPLHPFYNPIEKRQLLQAMEQGNAVVEIHIRCFDHIQMKAVRAQLILMRLEHFGLVLKSFPAPEDLLAGQWGRELIFTTKVPDITELKIIQDTLAHIAEVAEVKLRQLQPTSFESPER